MKGAVEVTPNGYSYREEQITVRTGVPYEMVSTCVSEGSRVAGPPNVPEGRSMPNVARSLNAALESKGTSESSSRFTVRHAIGKFMMNVW